MHRQELPAAARNKKQTPLRSRAHPAHVNRILKHGWRTRSAVALGTLCETLQGYTSMRNNGSSGTARNLASLSAFALLSLLATAIPGPLHADVTPRDGFLAIQRQVES